MIRPKDVFAGAGDQSGLGDTLQRRLAPKQASANGWIWGKVGEPGLILPSCFQK